MKLTKQIKTGIKDHAKECGPLECCGLILSSAEGSLEVYRCKNNQTKKGRFSINPKDYLKASEQGDIVAAYHSHLEGLSFSEFDMYNSNIHNIKYILFSMKENSFVTYDPNSELNEYVGREFEIGATDCFTLLKDFYKNELNISIRNYFRDEDWKKNLPDLFDKYFEKENFKEVKNLKKHDTLLFKTSKDDFSSHCAVYLGNQLMLHQPRNMISRIDEYDERYKRITNKIIRHKSLCRT